MSKALLPLAGGMLIVAGSLAGGYYVVGARGEARAATLAPATESKTPKVASVASLPDQQVEVKTGAGTVKMKWSELGIETDPDEVGRTQYPVKLDRDKAIKDRKSTRLNSSHPSISY